MGLHSYLNPLILIFLFLLIATTGTLLRTTNISPFKIYPDAYQNLLVSKNIQNHSKTIASLGKNGMEYPNFISWTRPVYPLMIYLAHLVIPNQTLASQITAALNGMLAVIISYFLTKQIFQSKTVGLMSALLLTISFNHVVWGGFILTETTGVLFMTLFLWSLLKNIHQKSQYAEISDLVTGLLFAIAIFTRYEYAVLFLSLTYLVLKQNPTPVYKLVNIYSSTIFISSIFITQLFPVQLFINKMLTQVQANLIILLTISIIAILLLALNKKIKLILNKIPVINFNYLPILLLWTFIFFLLLQALGFKFLEIHTAAIRDFIRDDIAISLFAIIGLTILLSRRVKINSIN